MKSLIIALTSLIVLPVYAGFEIVQEVEPAGAGSEKIQMTIQVEGDRARVDVGDSMTTIMSPDGAITTLMHDQKMAMEIPASVTEAMREKIEDQAENSTDSFEPTGRTETISGFQCKEYKATVAGHQATYWLTNDIPNQDEILEQLSSLGGKGDPFKGLFKDGKLPGFPIRTIVQAGNSAPVSTVLSIKEVEVADSEFDIPAGYKKAEMPQIPGMTAPTP